jgi:hypothetical protein
MRDTLFFYPRFNRVSVQNGSHVWSELLIPNLGVCSPLAGQDSEGTLPTVYSQALSGACYLLGRLVNSEQTKHVGGDMLCKTEFGKSRN